MAVASQLNYDILKQTDGNPDGLPVVYVGALNFDNNEVIKSYDVIGVSFFALDGGRNLRIHAFMRNCGYNYPKPNLEQMMLT